MSVGFESDLTSANTNAAFVSRTQDTDMVGKLDNQNATDATSTITGAVKTAGGLGVAKKAYLQQAFIPSLAGQKVLISSASKEVVESGVSDVEIDSLIGVSGNVQSQIDSKVSDGVVVHNTGNENIGGEKTFLADTFFDQDVVIDGNLTVNGTTTTVNSATLDVTDTNITVNNGGNDALSEGAGLTVERTGTHGSLVYEDALGSKFKAGPLASESEIITASPAQTITGTKTFNKINLVQELNLTEAIDSSSTGSNALVPLTAPVIRLTNASLVSIGNFDDVFNGKQVTITNDTGASVLIKNDSSGTAIKRILTGTGADLPLADEASLIISYDSNKTRWVVVGGSGSGAVSSTPTVQVFPAGVGTYTTPLNCAWIRVKVVGGGGGGAGSGASATPGTDGSDGTSSTFGAISAGKGFGGMANGDAGLGGSATLGLGSGKASPGSPGGVGSLVAVSAGAIPGGHGGNSVYGGAGSAGSGGSGQVATSAVANSGSGGGGGSPTSAALSYAGGGGGGGGYVETIIVGPAATYSYGVGSGGAGGAAGTGGNVGGAGADGYLVVEEYY